MWKRFKKKYIGDKQFYRHIIYLAIPMIIQNAVTSIVSFLDNIMVGRLGTEQMSGVAIVNQLIFVYSVCIFGGVSGAGIFGTQFYGKGDVKGQKYAFRFKIYACMFIAVITIILFQFLGTDLINLFLNDSSDVGDIRLALRYGKEYMRIIIVSIVPFAIGQVYTSSVRECGHTLVPMVASAVAVVINLILDAILIFGLLGCPRLGVSGAALATVIARIIECIIIVVWTHKNVNKNKYIKGAYESLYIPGKILGDICKKGTPLMINEILWATGMTAIVQCYAIRGLDVLAAQNISSTITNLFNIVYLQLGACIAIVVGQLLGAKQEEKAKDAVNKMLFFSVISCVFVAIVMVFIGGFFPNIYKTEVIIKELAKRFIFISAAVMPLCAFSHSAYFTLRSGGKTIITFIFDSLYVWIVLIPLAYCLCQFTSLNIVTVFFIVQFSEIIKVTIGYFMIRSGVWINNIVE